MSDYADLPQEVKDDLTMTEAEWNAMQAELKELSEQAKKVLSHG
jgi:hypothetical protein